MQILAIGKDVGLRDTQADVIARTLADRLKDLDLTYVTHCDGTMTVYSATTLSPARFARFSKRGERRVKRAIQADIRKAGLQSVVFK